MAIQIITDSASDVRPGEYSNITVLPMHICFGDEDFKDGYDLSHEEFYNKLIETDVLPTTSQIPPYDFSEAIRPIREQGDEVLIITMSAKLSGTYQSAVLAASEFADGVAVVDSSNATMGEKALICYALQRIEQGTSLTALADELNTAKDRIRLIALLDTLEYLKKGGRLSAGAATVGELLSIKPVLSITEGDINVLGKAHGSKNGHNLLIRYTEESGGIDFSMPLFLGYTGLSDRLLQKYIKDSHALWEEHMTADSLPILSVGATIGTHAGPGAIAVAFFAKS